MSKQMRTYLFGAYPIRCDTGSRMDKICVELKQEFPKLKMAHKRKVWFHWIYHFIIMTFTLGFNRNYIGRFTTTSKNRVDWSDKHHERIQSGDAYALDRVWSTLRHERVHLRQFEKYGFILMAMAYIHPPFIGLVYGRAMTEKPGYLESLRAQFEMNQDVARGEIKLVDGITYIEWLVGQFTGASYGWMWPFKKTVTKWFTDELAKLEDANDAS